MNGIDIGPGKKSRKTTVRTINDSFGHNSYLQEMWEFNEIKILNKKQNYEPPLLGHVQCALLYIIDIMCST